MVNVEPFLSLPPNQNSLKGDEDEVWEPEEDPFRGTQEGRTMKNDICFNNLLVARSGRPSAHPRRPQEPPQIFPRGSQTDSAKPPREPSAPRPCGRWHPCVRPTSGQDFEPLPRRFVLSVRASWSTVPWGQDSRDKRNTQRRQDRDHQTACQQVTSQPCSPNWAGGYISGLRFWEIARGNLARHKCNIDTNPD